MPRIAKWLKKELLRLIPVVIYFAISFNLVHYAIGLMLSPGSVRFTSVFGATLGAIVAGKVVLIAECLPFINAFPNKPAICNITWKFFIYSFFVILVQVVDYAVKNFYFSKSWSFVYAHLKTDLSRGDFWGTQILVLVFFLVFIVFSELTREIGEDRINKFIFG